jgi:Kef-type K+ transport system membrane component KefB
MMLLFDIGIIIVAARLAGYLAVRIGQPPVVGEITAGVLLAGLLRYTDLTPTMLASNVRGALGGISALAIVLFMFTVGYHWEPNQMRGQGRVTLAVAIGSMATPFVLGIALGSWLLTRYHPANSVQFVLFISTTMSITALPVLARILTHRKLTNTPVGGVALAAAAAVDATSWGVLAVIVALGGGGEAWHLVMAAPYLVVLFGLRPVISRALGRWNGTTVFGAVLAGLFLSAAATEWLGLHAVFGAFLVGAVLPHRDHPVMREHVEELGRMCHLFLLPIFFVVAALNVNLAGIGLAEMGDMALILAVAFAGKVGGSYLGARIGGMRGTGAMSVAALMNARGVTELVVLQVGLQLGVLNTTLYSLLVLMALLTTAAAGPLLTLVKSRAKSLASVADLTEPAPVAADQPKLAEPIQGDLTHNVVIALPVIPLEVQDRREAA